MPGLLFLFLCTLFFGFLAALVLQKVLHAVVRFRSEWNTTLIACTMSALVCEFTLFAAFTGYDVQVPGYLLKVIGTTALISLIAGTMACRLIIRSGSGRRLPVGGALFLAFILTAPPACFGVALHFLAETG